MIIKSFAFLIPCLIAVWIGILSLVAVSTDEAPAYVVLFPTHDFMKALPNGTSILAASGYSVTLVSEESGFARSLYQQGATIVLPAGLQGCLGSQKKVT